MTIIIRSHDYVGNNYDYQGSSSRVLDSYEHNYVIKKHIFSHNKCLFDEIAKENRKKDRKKTMGEHIEHKQNINF